MNKTQLAKLEKLQEAVANAEIAVASAKNEHEKVSNNTNADDNEKGEALKAFDDAVTALETARNDVADFEAEVAAAGKGKTNAKAKASADDEDAPKTVEETAAIKKGSVKVVATRDRRRIGRAFPAGQAVTIPVKDLKEGQLEALRNDPVLAVSEA